MSNAKHRHTPGPWEAILHEVEDVHDESGMTLVFAPGAETVVADCHCISGQSVEESEANARLIAAAPDLLAALEELDRIDNIKRNAGTQEYASGSIHAKAWKNARAAIAKTKGE